MKRMIVATEEGKYTQSSIKKLPWNDVVDEYDWVVDDFDTFEEAWNYVYDSITGTDDLFSGDRGVQIPGHEEILEVIHTSPEEQVKSILDRYVKPQLESIWNQEH